MGIHMDGAGAEGRDLFRSSAKSAGRGTKYAPPSNTGTMRLSETLQGTGRFPEPRQVDLLNRDEAACKGNTLLHYAGNIELLKLPCVAIVGTRQISEDGVKRTHHLARKLAALNIVVVSGLAKGVDCVAHTTAIEQGGKTVAVIGTPLDKAYPAENARLQEQIYREHLLISQNEPGERTYRADFPARNRLMARLSDATVVMEASDTSGTLHQAAECTKLGRWLFIAKSVVDDPNLTWPQKFLKYDTCVPLTDIDDITSRILR